MQVYAPGAEIGGSILIKDMGSEIAFDAPSLSVGGSLEVSTAQGSYGADRPFFPRINLDRATIRGDVALRLHSAWRIKLDRARIGSDLMLSDRKDEAQSRDSKAAPLTLLCPPPGFPAPKDYERAEMDARSINEFDYWLSLIQARVTGRLIVHGVQVRTAVLPAPNATDKGAKGQDSINEKTRAAARDAQKKWRVKPRRQWILPFWRSPDGDIEGRLVEYGVTKADARPIRHGLIYQALDPNGVSVPLPGVSPPIHMLSTRFFRPFQNLPPDRKDALQAAKQRLMLYLQFFCGLVWGDEGAFHIEDSSSIDLQLNQTEFDKHFKEKDESAEVTP